MKKTKNVDDSQPEENKIEPELEDTENESGSKMPKKNTRTANWLITWNNPTMTCDELYEHLKKVENLTYFRFQLEQVKTPHFHIYMEFSIRSYFMTFKESEFIKPMNKPRIESVRSRTHARNYCGKAESRISENYYEWGEFGNQGKRSDLTAIVDCIKDGMTNAEIMDIYPNLYLLHQNKIESVRQTVLNTLYGEQERNVEVNYIYGATGVGKTHFITQKHGYADTYLVDDYKYPFDNYKAQDVIVFEEFYSQSDIAITKLLKWLDKYPLMLPCRNKDKQACYTKVYFTSNMPLNRQYSQWQNPNDPDKENVWQALMRRIHNVYNFDNPYDRKRLENGEPNPNPFYKVRQIKMQVLELTETEKANMPF